jgi:hypothetical protein
MPDSDSGRSPHEDQRDAHIAKYYKAAERDWPLDPAEWLRQYPCFSAALAGEATGARKVLADTGAPTNS